MIRRKKQHLEWLEFEQLQEFEGLRHGIFLRSCGDFKGDLVLRESLLKHFEVEAMPCCRQDHGTCVKKIDEVKSGMHLIEGFHDAIITEKVGVALPILHADCQAAIFYDPVTGTIANVHSGWRGSVQNIYGSVMDHLASLGCKRENILVSISPSLGPERAEFVHYEKELPSEFHAFQVEPTYFDFWGISREQLKKAGVLESHIEIAEMCTHIDDKQFHSYRRDRTVMRNATVVARISAQ